MTESERLAVAILNEMHLAHGFQDVLKCKFCCSMRMQKILAGHIQALLDQSKREET